MCIDIMVYKYNEVDSLYRPRNNSMSPNALYKELRPGAPHLNLLR